MWNQEQTEMCWIWGWVRNLYLWYWELQQGQPMWLQLFTYNPSYHNHKFFFDQWYFWFGHAYLYFCEINWNYNDHVKVFEVETWDPVIALIFWSEFKRLIMKLALIMFIFGLASISKIKLIKFLYMTLKNIDYDTTTIAPPPMTKGI